MYKILIKQNYNFNQKNIPLSQKTCVISEFLIEYDYLHFSHTNNIGLGM